MKRFIVKGCVLMAAVMFLSITVMELNAHARAGGSRSSGSSGSRSYSRPASPYSQPRQQQQAAPAPSPFQQQAGGGFMRSMAGGIMGGMLGSMLFSSFAGAGAGTGMGGGAGGGIGMLEIILLAGLGYLIYRFIKKRRADNSTLSLAEGGYSLQGTPPTVYQAYETPVNEVATGLSHVQQMDSSFDENRFNDLVMDIFFNIQGAWMNRNLSSVSGLLTNEMTRVFQEDLDRMLKDKQINRLENIAVRKVEISEVWQESGRDYITVLIYANLLDYTTDDTTGAVVAGSKTEPVKFEEYWTFSRSVGNNPWQLSAISQK
jgi:predicted lipid-binding transport protein (Tim44 family)